MPKRSYAQFCPVARSLDLLGERWTMLIVRELATSPLRFTDLRDRLPGCYPNLLGSRLRELEAAGLVTRRELPPPAARTVYELTERGSGLTPVLMELARWGLPLLDAPTDDEPVLPHLLPGGLQALWRLEELPDRAMAVALELDEGRFRLDLRPARADDGRRRPLWQRVAVTEVEGTAEPPATAANVVLRSSIPVLLWVRRGELDLDAALADGHLALEGEPVDVEVVRRLLGPQPPG